MSIRRKPEKAVPVLLARLEKAMECVDEFNRDDRLVLLFQEIKNELEGIGGSVGKINKWEKSVLEQFCVLEQDLDDDVFKDRESDKISDKLEQIKGDIVNLKELISKFDLHITEKLRTMTRKPKFLPHIEDDETVSKDWVTLGIEKNIFSSMAMDNLRASFICLEKYQLKTCLFCLTMFPENAVIKKRTLIYWWIGEGLVNKMKDKTAEEVGEQVFQELINEGFIKPISKNNSPSINSCKVHPWIHRMLILAADKINFFSFDSNRKPCNGSRRAYLHSAPVGSNDTNFGDKEDELKTVFNINEQYLEFKVDWLPKLKSVEVLQLGRWQNSTKHHIEIENKEPLNGLGSQKQLKYLSLRGISRIDTLPSSIVKLDSLTILDLRACHNLEKLPTGMWLLRHLTHLDVSECYLLESIPKGVQHLSSLQVLKGFVIGNLGKNTCKISDLERLKNLRKLSIRVGGKAVEQKEEFARIINFKNLRVLAISWRLESSKLSNGNEIVKAALSSFSIPRSLEKLDLLCLPLTTVPEWLWPSKLQTLKKLYVRGGQLESLNHKEENQHWKIKILRLKYLKCLKIEKNELLERFPELLYLERVSCHKNCPDIIILNEDGQQNNHTPRELLQH